MCLDVNEDGINRSHCTQTHNLGYADLLMNPDNTPKTRSDLLCGVKTSHTAPEIMDMNVGSLILCCLQLNKVRQCPAASVLNVSNMLLKSG